MRKQPGYLIVALIALATTAVYWQVSGFQLVNFDDALYITQNAHIQSGLTGESVSWAFTTGYESNWMPLVWLSYMLDRHIFGLSPGGLHFTNLLLHILASIAFFLAFDRMTRSPWRSGFVAALFALHPAHVESVAWVAERKDVLSGLLWALTLLAYARYAERPGVRRYLPVLLLFALGLMAKPMLVTLPFTLLLLDYWPLGRFSNANSRALSRRALIWEKAPLFALSAASCVVTYLVQKAGGAVGSLDRLPIGVRFANAIVSYISYAGKMLWPANLAVIYPHPGPSLPVWQVVVSAGLLLVVTLLVFVAAGKRPYLPAGWLWYLGTLLPVIGLVQVGNQAMADRYTYIPLIGLFLIAAHLIPDLVGRSRPVATRLWLPAAAGLLVLAALSWRQIGYWRDSVTLFTRAIDCTSRNYIAHGNLGTALGKKGKSEEALRHLRKALEINPRYAEGHNNLGVALDGRGLTREAVQEFRSALQLNPKSARARNNMAGALSKLGRYDEAAEQAREALRIAPDEAEGHYQFGLALAGKEDLDEAIAEYSEAVRIDPGHAEAHSNLGVILGMQGRLDRAIRHFRMAAKLVPDDADTHQNLAVALYLKGDYAAAWKEIHLCRKYGGRPEPRFLRDLSRKMPDPDK